MWRRSFRIQFMRQNSKGLKPAHKEHDLSSTKLNTAVHVFLQSLATLYTSTLLYNTPSELRSPNISFLFFAALSRAPCKEEWGLLRFPNKQQQQQQQQQQQVRVWPHIACVRTACAWVFYDKIRNEETLKGMFIACLSLGFGHLKHFGRRAGPAAFSAG